MSPTNSTAGVRTDTRANGHSSAQEVFLLSDEQILEIVPDAQDAEVGSGEQSHPAGGGTGTVETPGAAQNQTAVNDQTLANDRAATNDATKVAEDASAAKPAQNGISAEPPAWLAAQMKDPWNGADARELWDTTQRVTREAAAYREIFAKPEDAHALAERARTLDDIDRAYFAGDAAQRAQLAAMMMREDPAAFREMVFEGLRALEGAGQSGRGRGSELAPGANLASPGGNGGASSAGGASPSRTGRGEQVAANGENGAGHRDHDAPQREDAAHQRISGERSSQGNDSAQKEQLSAYAAFERSANEDLERSVGSAIERTLTQALPSIAADRGRSAGPGQQGASLQERLTIAIRQDIEKALQSDPQLSEQVAQILSGRRFDKDTRAHVVRLINERAQQLVPGAARRALKDWTQTTLAAHQGKSGKFAQASSTDLARVASTSTSRMAAAATATPQTKRETQNRETATRSNAKTSRLDYHKLSDEQILEL
jgi:hypothetical protein